MVCGVRLSLNELELINVIELPSINSSGCLSAVIVSRESNEPDKHYIYSVLCRSVYLPVF